MDDDATTSIRPRRLAAALAICACSFAMAYAVDHGVTRPWPEWARALWAFTLIGGGIGGVLLALTAAGLVTDASVAGQGDLRGRPPTARTALLVYAGS